MKNGVKKILTLMMALCLTACSSPAASSEKAFTAGTYSASAKGNNGDVTVEVTVDAQAITAVTIKEHAETEGIADAALTTIPEAIVSQQSLNIDTVSGATNTSKAILEAAAACLKQAGGDVEALQTKPKATAEARDEIQLNADVVVVGGGGAGLSAALSAAENNASVIVVEKAGNLGGTTITSGAFYSTGDPELAKRSKMNDTMRDQVDRLLALEPNCEQMKSWQDQVKEQYQQYLNSGSEAMFDSEEYYMLCVYVDGGMTGDPDLIEWTCANADEGYAWLEEHGYHWSDKVVIGKNGDNAVIEPDIERCRRLVADSEYGRPATQMIDILSQQAQAVGSDTSIYTNVAATELILDEGRVVGIKALGSDGTPYTITADNGVVLASGGFASGVELREEYNTIYPYLGEQVHSTNVATDTGDGLVMAKAAGAQLIDMEKIQVNKITHYDLGGTDCIAAAFSNLLINEQGQRFTNEYGSETEVSKAILSQSHYKAFLLADAHNSNITEGKTSGGRDLEEAVAQGYVFKADTIEALAQQLQIDPAVLTQTIEQFNAAIDQKQDPEFGRTILNEEDKLLTAPFYATPVIPSVHHTMGGLKINAKAQVLNQQDEPISGLFAAGEIVGGLSGNNRMSGDAIMANVVQGRVAGAEAANND